MCRIWLCGERACRKGHVQQKKYLIVALAKHVEVPRDATRHVSRRFLRSGWRHRFGFAKCLPEKEGEPLQPRRRRKHCKYKAGGPAVDGRKAIILRCNLRRVIRLDARARRRRGSERRGRRGTWGEIQTSTHATL